MAHGWLGSAGSAGASGRGRGCGPGPGTSSTCPRASLLTVTGSSASPQAFALLVYLLWCTSCGAPLVVCLLWCASCAQDRGRGRRRRALCVTSRGQSGQIPPLGNTVQVKAAFGLNTTIAQGGLGVGSARAGWSRHQWRGGRGMAAGFGHDRAGSGVEVVGREDNVDPRLIVARAGFNGLHIFPAARG
jgi:hypothetical protein